MTGRGISAGALTVALLLSGCAVGTASAPASTERSEAPRSSQSSSQKTVDPAQVERLKRAMLPLLRAMDRPRAPGEVKVGVVDDPDINAANAGNGEFYVTTGLLQKASDDQLLAIMAHEVAHEDLGHVAKQQALGTGIGIGAVILDQIIPGAGRVAPIAGALIQRTYSRSEEYAADRHGVQLLERVGRDKQVMIATLTWLMDTSGPDAGGGFFSTHPATGDRIDVLRKL
jgi:Zn-dependent protease with chaperone function